MILDASLVSEKKKKKKKSSETDKDKYTDRFTGTETKTKRNTSPGRGSTHRDQSTGNFMVDTMIQCINEIKQVKAEAAAKDETPKLSRNMIQAKQYLCLLLSRQGALFVEFADIYHPGALSYELLALCLHLCLLILLPFCPLHLIYPLKQGENLLDLFSSKKQVLQYTTKTVGIYPTSTLSCLTVGGAALCIMCSSASPCVSVEVDKSFLIAVFSSILISSSKIILSDCWIIFTGTACLHFYKEKKHIQLNVCFA